MAHTALAVVGVLFIIAVALGFVALVVSDVRQTYGEGSGPGAQQGQDAHRDAERRVNRGARSGGL